MAVASPPQYSKRPAFHRRTPSGLQVLHEEGPAMSDPIPIPPKTRSQPELGVSELSSNPLPGDTTHGSAALLDGSSESKYSYSSSPNTPGLSRTPSFSNVSGYRDDVSDDGSFFPPVERLTMFDFIENLALTERLEKIQSSIQVQTEKVKRQQQRLTSRGMTARDRVVDEWRRRLPGPDEQLEKYKKRMRQSVDRLNERWDNHVSVTAREKMSFIAGVVNIFASGYLVGARPHWFHYWYTVQLLYFMPIRYYAYHKRGYHYFLADLCYFVNLLVVMSIWVFPQSKRLFIATYCLAFGNNAVAIAMWRNSLVFHSMDKIVSLFIHIMPCVTLHCLVHLIPPELQQARYPAIYTIRYSPPSSPEHYNLFQMILWATMPYAVWQLSYHLLITVRRREKIAAGRPTSFTWLRKSYAKNFLGKFVLSLPQALQEPAFMMIQYLYACITMLPCPLWFRYRWASGGFLFIVFIWSIYNGATFYIDVFGKRFQKELEMLKKDVAKWQNSPGMEPGFGGLTPGETPSGRKSSGDIADSAREMAKTEKDIDRIPPLEGSSGVKFGEAENGGVRERKQ